MTCAPIETLIYVTVAFLLVLMLVFAGLGATIVCRMWKGDL